MNRIRIWMLVLSAAAALAVHVALMPFAMPTAALHMTLDRAQAIERGRRVLTELGLRPPSDTRVAVSFVTDPQTKGWLEQRLGIAGSNRMAQREGLVYRWIVRFYRLGDLEQWGVELDPEGVPLGVRWMRPDDRAAPATDDPRGVAVAAIRKHFDIELDARWRSVESLQTPLPNRLDHVLTWERTDRVFAGARQRLSAEISGGAIVSYRRWLHIPDHLLKEMERNQSKGDTLANAAQAAGLVFVVVVLWTLVITMARRTLFDRKALKPLFTVAVAVALVELLNTINMLPLVQAGLQPEDTLYGFWLQYAAFSAISIAVLLLTTAGMVIAADLISHQAFPHHGRMGSWFTRRRLASPEGLRALGAGYAFIPLQLGYVSVFYWLVSRLGGWSPADVPYDDLFSTSMPWAFALLIGVSAAVSEEFLFRYVAVSWLKRVTGRTWLAVLVPAMIWAFAHCNYPNQPFYIRGIELTIWGCIWGVVYIRMGPLPSLLSHAGFNALLVGESLLSSGMPMVRGQFYLVCLLVMLPGLLALWWRRQRADLSTEAEASPGQGGSSESHDTTDATADSPASCPVVTTVTPLRARDWKLAALLAAVSLIVIAGLYWLSERQARWRWPEERLFSTTVAHRSTVARSARQALSQQGLKPLNGRVSLTMEERTQDADVVAYLRQYLSNADTSRLLDRVLGPPVLWLFRDIKGLSVQAVLLRPDGSVYAVEQRLPEQAPGARLSRVAALTKAHEALRRAGINPQWLNLKGHDVEQLPARTRHRFTWHLRNVQVGDARFVVEISVDGQIAGSPYRYVQLPDAFLFERARFRPEQLLALVSLLLSILLGVRATAVWVLALRLGPVPWRAATGAVLWTAAASIVIWFLRLPTLWTGLSPETPAVAYVSDVIVSNMAQLLVTVLILAGAIGPSVNLWRRCFKSPDVRTVWMAAASPRAYASLWADAWMRTLYMVLIGLVAIAGLLLPGVWPPSLSGASLPGWLTAWYVPPSVSQQPVWWVIWPGMYLAAHWVSLSIMITAAAAIALPVAKLSLKTPRIAWGVLLVILFTAVPQQCRTPMEYTQTGVAVVAVLYLLHHLARRVFMPNLLVAPVVALYAVVLGPLLDCGVLQGGWGALSAVLAVWLGVTVLAWRNRSRSENHDAQVDACGAASSVTDTEAGENIRE